MNNPRRIQRHLVKAFAAGTLLAAAALPLAIASVAGATTLPAVTAVAFTPDGTATNSVGAGAQGTVAITGTGFINDGGNVTLTAACTPNTDAYTFSSVTETSATTATASFTSTGTVAATCTLSITDDGGAQATPLASAFTVDAAPTITSISPASVWEATSATTVTITGTGFAASPTVSFAATSNGTSVTSSVTSSTSTTIVLSVTPTNPVNSSAATPGTYAVTVTNTDGGSVTDAAAFTVGNGVENASPSAVPASATTSSTTVAILGSGFEYGATVSFTGGANCSTSPEVSVTSATVNSPTSVTAVISETGTTTALCGLTVTNPGSGGGGNGLSFNTPGALGIGEAATVAPIITAASPSTPIVVGSAAVAVTLTGSGFSSFSPISGAPSHVTYSAATGSTGTTLTFNATVASLATQGADSVTVQGTTFSPAITVAGPVITSAAPNLVQGAAFGSSITLTGTGFTNTTTGTVNAGGTGLAGTVSYVSPTTLSLVVTTSPTSGSTATVTLTQVTSTGTVVTAPFALTIDAPPVITSAVTYKTGTDVGVGATAQTIYIHGTGFATGATVTAFVNGASVADPNVTATVTAVTATQITATVAVKAPDTNATVGYTVTNTDGGVAKVAAFSYPIFIGAGPTITSVTPATGAAGATTSFAIAGTGFQTGAVVTLTPANGVCGTTTVSASTTIAVTCALGAAGVTPTSLVVTNPDGGSTTSSPVLAAETAPAFHVSGVHGAAVVGKTVTVIITGTGFYGQPKITSAGFKFGVTKDSGSALTVRVTASATAKSGEHSLTVTLANGKSGKAGFNTKK